MQVNSTSVLCRFMNFLLSPDLQAYLLRSRCSNNLTQDRSTSTTEQAISPLRRRMIEDVAIRQLGAKTQHDYVQRVKDFAVFLGRSPDKASKEDPRRYQLHLSESGAHTPKINVTVSFST